MGRDALRQAEKRAEPFLFGLAKVLHVIPAFRPADHGCYGYEQDIFQHVGFCTIKHGDRSTLKRMIGDLSLFFTFKDSDI